MTSKYAVLYEILKHRKKKIREKRGQFNITKELELWLSDISLSCDYLLTIEFLKDNKILETKEYYL